MSQPIMYANLVTVAEDQLKSAGIQDPVNVAEGIAAAFCRVYGGDIYRVPTLKGMQKAERDSQIRNDALTMNVRELSKKHDLSATQIREVLSA